MIILLFPAIGQEGRKGGMIDESSGEDTADLSADNKAIKGLKNWERKN